MRKRIECGVWEMFIPGLDRGTLYKFEIHGPNGELGPLKADPVAFAGERPPSTASMVRGLVEHDFGDQEWMARRGAADPRERPISIYEVHLGSWRRVCEEGNRYLTWRELAETLVPYAADMGFTHSSSSRSASIRSRAPGATSRSASSRRRAASVIPPTSPYFVESCHQRGSG